MSRLESIVRFIIFASMLLSLILPRLVFANAPESPHYLVEKPATTAEIQVPIPSLEVQTFSPSCDNFMSSLDGWTAVSSSGSGTVSNPPGLMRLSSTTSASGITVKKPLVGYSGSITITSIFTSNSPTTMHFWVEYSDASIDYIFAEGTSSGGVQTYTPTYTTPAGKVPVALYFYAAVSSLFPPFRVDIDQICVTALSSGQTLYLPVISQGPNLYPFAADLPAPALTHPWKIPFLAGERYVMSK